MLGGVTLRQTASHIQQFMPSRLGWWNGLATAERRVVAKQLTAQISAAKRAAKTSGKKKASSRVGLATSEGDAFTRAGRISAKDWHELFHA